MATTVAKNEFNTTLTFSITAPSTKLDPILDKWAEYAYNHGFGTITTGEGEEAVTTPYAELTNVQKFAVIDARIRAVGLAESNAQEDADTQAAKLLEKTVHDLENIN